MLRIAIAVVIVTAGVAWADPVPDAALRAVTDRSLRLELDDATIVEGRLLAFDAEWLALATAGTNELVAVPRARVRHVILASLATPPARALSTTGVAPEPHRIWGLHFGLPGTLVGDVDYGIWHAFVSPNVLLPILTVSGDSSWYAGALGAGVSLHASSRWKFDAFATVMPLHFTSYYTYLATGLGVGFHYTAASGLSIGFALPVLGFAARLGRSPYGYDPPFRYNDSLDYFYLAGFTALPLVTVGYRFPCRRAR